MVGLIIVITTAVTFFLVGGPEKTETSPSGTQGSSTTCSITGAPVGAELRVLADSGTPIAGARVNGSSTAYCNGQPQTTVLPVVTTNSSGWADLAPVYASYDLTVSYAGQTYHVSLPNRPMSATYATLFIPSENLTTSFCFGGHQCSSQSTAVT